MSEVVDQPGPLTLTDDWEQHDQLPTPADVAEGEEFERRNRAKTQQLFKQLKAGAQAIYGLMDGGVGMRSTAQWAELLEQAGDALGSGEFLVRTLGAERYLDPKTVALLLTLRQNLIAELPRPTAMDLMLIDSAILAYYNQLRLQGWIGNSALVIESGLFGQDLRDEYHGEATAEKIEEQVRRLADVILPMQDRMNRMMVRNLADLRSSSSSRKRKASA
jgi:hypothetical protein